MPDSYPVTQRASFGEIHGALGKLQLDKLDAFLKIRRMNAAHFVNLFKNDEAFIIQKEVGESSWFCFTMIGRRCLTRQAARNPKAQRGRHRAQG